MCDEIRLVRHDGDTPWGFRLTGGRDFGTPLLVVKVIGGSIAALAGVHVGDIVRGINYKPTNDFTHLDAQRAILEATDTLVLNLIRGEEVEEFEKKVENLELSFVVKLNRSGRISAVEEISTPCTTPLPQSPSPEKQAKSRSGSGDRTRSMSRGSRGSLGTQQQQQEAEVQERKPKVTLTVMDDGPITMKPYSSSQVETSSQNSVTRESKSANKEITDEITLHEEMMLETSMKKTTTKITERSEEEFVNGVRGEIVSRARKENRELTEDEIMEMMAGEAEVLDEDKGTIGVNFQKYIPRCDFIKDSSVFKALQEEQTKKEKPEPVQLMKDPTKRFSKFLIKPNTPKPLPKPKPVQAEPLAWQKKMENENLDKKNACEKPSGNTELKSPEGEKTLIHENEKSAFQSTQIEQRTEDRQEAGRKEQCMIETSEEHAIQVEESTTESSTMYSASSACKKSTKAFSISTTNDESGDKEDEEYVTNKSSSNKRKDSDESSTSGNNSSGKKRSSLSSQSEERRSKAKKVGFLGVEERNNIEKQLEEIQKEMLTLQRLPLEIQNHLLIVQKSLQDIVAQQSQRQSPVSGMERDADDDSEEEIDKFLKETDEEFDNIYKDQEEEEETETIEDYVYAESRRQTMEEDEITADVEVEEESLMEDQEERVQQAQVEEEDAPKEEVETRKQLPHGQEDVEMCEAERKPGFPLTPQLRPIVLPGGRMWRQPKDAYNEEFIAETIVSQSEVLVGTTIGVNFRKYIPPKFDSANSAVYRLIHELEGKSMKGVAQRPEKVHELDKYYNAPIDKRHFYAATLTAEKKHVDNLERKTQPCA